MDGRSLYNQIPHNDLPPTIQIDIKCYVNCHSTVGTISTDHRVRLKTNPMEQYVHSNILYNINVKKDVVGQKFRRMLPVVITISKPITHSHAPQLISSKLSFIFYKRRRCLLDHGKDFLVCSGFRECK